MPEFDSVGALKNSAYEESGLLSSTKCGAWVSINPCSKEDNPENKTFLGVYLGDIALSVSFTVEPDEKQLVARFSGHNPAIFVPDLNKVVFGYESWWGEIESPSHLRQITDDTIANVWYVKALKDLEAREVEKAEGNGE